MNRTVWRWYEHCRNAHHVTPHALRGLFSERDFKMLHQHLAPSCTWRPL